MSPVQFRSETTEGDVPDLGDATTWTPVDLGNVLAGTGEEPPSMLARTDGHCLLYRGRVHALQAEPEALKTWLALKACAELLRRLEPVAYLDFEDSPGSIVARLEGLGVPTEAIVSSLIYVRPDEPLSDRARAELDQHVIAREAQLAVIDGLTEAFSRQGLNPLDNADVAVWLDLLPRRFTRAGMAVLMLDHVVKDREQRGRYAIGAQHKLAGVDVAYSMRVVEPFARGREGLVAIKVEKDRPGRVREYAADGQVAVLRATSLTDGAVRLQLEPPEQRDGTFRPTGQMERISLTIEADPGLSKRAIREAVGGKVGVADLALGLLVAEGHVEVRRDGQAHHHHSLAPYREDDDSTHRDPVTQPCPGCDPDTVKVDRDPVTAPLRARDTEHSPPDTHKTPNRDPACVCADGGQDPDQPRTLHTLLRHRRAKCVAERTSVVAHFPESKTPETRPLGDLMTAIEARFELPDDLVEAIAQRVAGLVVAQSAATSHLSPWLDVNEAAEYMRCKPKRLYDLASQRRVPAHRDGGRLLFRRDELDEYLSANADTALTPGPNGQQRRAIEGGVRSINPQRVGGRDAA